MASQLKKFDEKKCKIATKKYKFYTIFFEMIYYAPAFKVFIIASDLEFWIEVSEYY